MKPLYSEQEFLQAKSRDKLPCECYQCNCVFYMQKKFIKSALHRNVQRNKYCSVKCQALSRVNIKHVFCGYCKKTILKMPSEIKNSKSGLVFCSQSCAAIYSNSHKTHGIRISKAEIYIQNKLLIHFPELVFHFNKRDVIKSELDIFIPKLNLAFEINGIHHYEPIYNQEKLDKIKNNDIKKHCLCYVNNIDLFDINTSSLKHFYEHKADIFYHEIENIILTKLVGYDRLAQSASSFQN